MRELKEYLMADAFLVRIDSRSADDRLMKPDFAPREECSGGGSNPSRQREYMRHLSYVEIGKVASP